MGSPAALAAILASAAFFLDTNAAPDVAFAIWMRASRAFCKSTEEGGFHYLLVGKSCLPRRRLSQPKSVKLSDFHINLHVYSLGRQVVKKVL